MAAADVEKLESLQLLRQYIRETHHACYESHLIHVGDFSYGIPEISTWDEETELSIGKFCSFAVGVKILMGGEHRTDWATTYPFNALIPAFSGITGHPQSRGNIVIGNDVWIGTDVKILSGVTIGDGAVIAANALVTDDVPAYSIAGGVPAKHLKYRFDEDTIQRMLEMQWWNWRDEALVMAIPLLQSARFEELWAFYRGMKQVFGNR